jgi:putative heme-binding domain-containing protein
MYRLWVEHPKFLPPEIAEKLDWRAGDDRGRIYRMVPSGTTTEPYQPPTTSEQLVAFLDDANAWRQTLAQRLLVQRQQFGAIPAIRQLLATGARATSRLRALWTLQGLGDLKSEDVLLAMRDDNAYLRRDGVKLASQWIGEDAVFDAIAERAGDNDMLVRFQVALALGESDRAEASLLLANPIALRDGGDSWFAQAILSSARDRAGYILRSLVSTSDFANAGSAAQVNLIKQLATVVGVRGDIDELNGVFSVLLSADTGHRWWRSAMISGLGKGLPRHRGKLGRTSLPKLLASPPDGLAESAQQVKLLLEENQRMATDPTASIADRVVAIELLAYQPFDQASKSLSLLLGSGQPSAVHSAAIDSLTANGSAQAAKIVLAAWPGLAPSVRSAAVTMLLRRVDSTKLALDAMLQNRMSSSVLSIDQRVRLLKHQDPDILAKAKQLLGGAVSSNRQQVANEYRKSLDLTASAQAGRQVFGRVCSNCHRINGEGHITGPDLSDTRNRSKLALLFDILDPNAKVEPRFTACTVLLDDGNVFTGLIGSETADAIVLNMAEGKQRTINRDQIDEIKISSVSLMPEGVEKDVTVQQMADLLEFLRPSE